MSSLRVKPKQNGTDYRAQKSHIVHLPLAGRYRQDAFRHCIPLYNTGLLGKGARSAPQREPDLPKRRICIERIWWLCEKPSEIMLAVRQKPEGFCPNDRIELQGSIKVWKKRAIARRLKSKRAAQPVFLRRNENQTILASKIFFDARIG
jgi:hypothetical protein